MLLQYVYVCCYSLCLLISDVCMLSSALIMIFIQIWCYIVFFFFFFQAEDGIRDYKVTGVQTCALPISGCDREPRALGGRPQPVRGAVGQPRLLMRLVQREPEPEHPGPPLPAVDECLEIGRASCRERV